MLVFSCVFTLCVLLVWILCHIYLLSPQRALCLQSAQKLARVQKKQKKQPTISKTGAHCNVIVRFSSGRRTNTLRGCLRLWICWTDTTIWGKKHRSKLSVLRFIYFFSPHEDAFILFLVFFFLTDVQKDFSSAMT